MPAAPIQVRGKAESGDGGAAAAARAQEEDKRPEAVEDRVPESARTAASDVHGRRSSWLSFGRGSKRNNNEVAPAEAQPGGMAAGGRKSSVVRLVRRASLAGIKAMITTKDEGAENEEEAATIEADLLRMTQHDAVHKTYAQETWHIMGRAALRYRNRNHEREYRESKDVQLPQGAAAAFTFLAVLLVAGFAGARALSTDSATGGHGMESEVLQVAGAAVALAAGLLLLVPQRMVRRFPTAYTVVLCAPAVAASLLAQEGRAAALGSGRQLLLLLLVSAVYVREYRATTRAAAILTLGLLLTAWLYDPLEEEGLEWERLETLHLTLELVVGVAAVCLSSRLIEVLERTAFAAVQRLSMENVLLYTWDHSGFRGNIAVRPNMQTIQGADGQRHRNVYVKLDSQALVFATLDALNRWLEKNAIQTSTWAETALAKLLREATLGVSALHYVHTIGALRILRIARIKIFGSAKTANMILVEARREVDGKSSVREKLVTCGHTMNEEASDAGLRAVEKSLGDYCPNGGLVENDILGYEPEVSEVQISESYPGLRTKYIIATLKLQLPKLPTADFTTEEERKDGKIMTHYWSWRTQSQVKNMLDGIKWDQRDKHERLCVVFTDIEGSTSLWEWNAGLMSEAQELHDQLLRTSLSKFDGYEVQTEGDAFQVSFHSTMDALGWCLHVQTELLKEPYASKFLGHDKTREVLAEDGSVVFRGLRVRMGMHSGQVRHIAQHDKTRRAVFKGELIQRAKIISDSGHGGQVLLSGEAWQEVLGDLSALDHPQVVDLGEHVIEGIATAQHVMQVLPKRLVGRNAHFERIKSTRVISPACFDAPQGVVTIVFCKPCKTGGVSEWSERVAQAAMRKANGLVRETLHEHNGYECQEDDGMFMLAFSTPDKAARWAVAVMSSMFLLWPKSAAEDLDDELKEAEGEEGEEEKRAPAADEDEKGGLRLRIGMYTDVPVEARPHAATGRMDYFGPFVNRAARVCATAKPGHIIVDERSYQSIAQASPAIPTAARGTVSVKGVDEMLNVYEVLVESNAAPSALAAELNRMDSAGATGAGASPSLPRTPTADTSLLFALPCPGGGDAAVETCTCRLCNNLRRAVVGRSSRELTL